MKILNYKEDICFYTSVLDVRKDIEKSYLTASAIGLDLGLIGVLGVKNQLNELEKIVDFCEENFLEFDGTYIGAAENFVSDDKSSTTKMALKLIGFYEKNESYLAYQAPIVQSQENNHITYTLLELNTNINWIVEFQKQNGEWS